MTTCIDTSHLIYSSLSSDPDLAELADLFAEEMPQKVAAIRDLYERQNCDQLLRLVHQLKGAAGSYGFGDVTPFAAQLEHSLKTATDSNLILEQLQGLLAICNRVRPFSTQHSASER